MSVNDRRAGTTMGCGSRVTPPRALSSQIAAVASACASACATFSTTSTVPAIHQTRSRESAFFPCSRCCLRIQRDVEALAGRCGQVAQWNWDRREGHVTMGGAVKVDDVQPVQVAPTAVARARRREDLKRSGKKRVRRAAYHVGDGECIAVQRDARVHVGRAIGRKAAGFDVQLGGRAGAARRQQMGRGQARRLRPN